MINMQLMTFDEVNTRIDQPIDIMLHGLINHCIQPMEHDIHRGIHI